MSDVNRAQQAACRHWDQTGQRLPVLVLDLDRGEAWSCRPSSEGAYARLLCRMDAWPRYALTEAEISRLNGPMRRYIASGRHPLREGGCRERLEEFDARLGGAIDQLCEEAAASPLPFVGVLTIGRLARFYPAEYRVRCMFSFAPLAPDASLCFMSEPCEAGRLLGRTVALEVLMRQPDGSVVSQALPAAGADTPLEQLTGEALPGLPAMLGVPGGEVRLLVDGARCHVKLAGLGLPQSGALFAIGLSVKDGQLMCHLNGRALPKGVSAPVVPS